MWAFQKVGILCMSVRTSELDNLLDAASSIGIEDFDCEEETVDSKSSDESLKAEAKTADMASVIFYCNYKEIASARNSLVQNGFQPSQVDIIYRATTRQDISSPENKEAVQSFLEYLEDLDEVQEVYHNANL